MWRDGDIRGEVLLDFTIYTIGGGWGKEIPDEQHQEPVAVIRGTDIPKVQLGIVEGVPRRWESSSKVTKRQLQPGDLVIEVSGGSAQRGQHTGRVLYISEKTLQRFNIPVIPASFCRLLRLDTTRVDPQFIAYQINLMHLDGSIAKFEVQSTGIANFQFKTFLESIRPAIEDVPTQRAIARILGTLDDKIELNRRMNKTLEAMAQALFKSWFVDFDPVVINALRAGNSIPEKFAKRAAYYREILHRQNSPLPEEERSLLSEDILRLFPTRFVDSVLGPIPEGWEVKAIGEVVKCVGGGTPSTKKPKFWAGGTNPFLTPKDMASLDAPVVLDTERYITDDGVERISSGQLPVGTVLLSSRAPIGYLAINAVPVSVNQGIIAMICEGSVSNYYVYFWVKENLPVIKSKAGGTTFAEISKRNFRSLPMLIPSVASLEKFGSITGSIFTMVVENARSSRTLATLRDTLLPKLISGELRVPDVEKILKDAL